MTGILEKEFRLFDVLLFYVKRRFIYKLFKESAASEVTSAGSAVSDVILAETVDVENPIEEISMAEGDATALGKDFAEIFEKYAPFGITYEEAEGSSGRGNVYYNGQLVSQFSDLTPDGGAFTFSSVKGKFCI